MMETKKLYRSSANKVFTGVCGGIAEYFNIDPVIVRLLWAVITCFSAGLGFFGYIIASVIIPEKSDDGQEKRRYGCLYAICIFVLAAVAISVVSWLFKFLGFGLLSGFGMTGSLLSHGSADQFFAFGPFTLLIVLLNGIVVLAIIVLLIFIATKIGRKDK